jgi:hypothetical protein
VIRSRRDALSRSCVARLLPPRRSALPYVRFAARTMELSPPNTRPGAGHAELFHHDPLSVRPPLRAVYPAPADRPDVGRLPFSGAMRWHRPSTRCDSQVALPPAALILVQPSAWRPRPLRSVPWTTTKTPPARAMELRSRTLACCVPLRHPHFPRGIAARTGGAANLAVASATALSRIRRARFPVCAKAPRMR